MPELPEVETIVRDLRPRLLGRRIGKTHLSHDDVLRGVTRRSLIRLAREHGVEMAYVLEGTVEYSFEDKPSVTLKAGESLYIPAGTPHAAHNTSEHPAAELATYLVEKGKPIVVLRPAAH